MWAVALAGLVCELSGLGIAAWGVDQLGNELSLGHVLPHRQALRWLRQRRLVRWIGLGPKPITVNVGAATLKLEAMTASARGYATRPRPSDAAPGTEWAAYWDSRLTMLSDQIAALRQDVKDTDDDLAKRLSEEAAERQKADADLARRQTTLFAGEGGSGLVKTWSGLGVTMIGVLLSGLAQLFG